MIVDEHISQKDIHIIRQEQNGIAFSKWNLGVLAILEKGLVSVKDML